MLDLFIKGGALMYPILLCSVFALAMFLAKFFEYRQAFAELTAGAGRAGTTLLKPFAALFSRPHHEEEISILWARALHGLEKGLSYLGLTANIATLLGLAGTVTGMIKTFMVVARLHNADPSLLAGGIWEALITTAFGLFVAIPTHVGLHYLEKESDEIALVLKENVLELKHNGGTGA
jgi:biopolymer transport protein ExbB